MGFIDSIDCRWPTLSQGEKIKMQNITFKKMRGLFLSGLVGLLALAVFWQVTGFAQEVETICSVPDEYGTVQAAIDTPDCQTIEIGAGTFVENLIITRTVTLQGAGLLSTTIDGGGSGTVITAQEDESTLLEKRASQGLEQATEPVVVTVNDVEIVNGEIGVYVTAATLILNQTTISRNEGEGMWALGSASLLNLDMGTIELYNSRVISNGGRGGINRGTMVLSNTIVSENGGGGLLNLNQYSRFSSGGDLSIYHSMISSHTITGTGGGISSSGVLRIEDSAIFGNSATNGGGVEIFYESGDLLGRPSFPIIVNTDIYSNSASGQGGGIYSDDFLTLEKSRIYENVAGSGGGGIANILLSSDDNQYFNQMVIEQSEIMSNSAELGGGIYQEGTLLLDLVLIGQNRAAAGGGLYNGGEGEVTRLSLVGNQATGNGGGVYNGGQIRFEHATLSGNRADERGGGLFHTGTGSTISFTHSTLVENGAGVAGGTLYVEETILLAGNTIFDQNGPESGCEVANAGIIRATSRNGLSPQIDCFDLLDGFNHITGVDFRFGPLTANGEGLLGHPLLADSPLIDQGACPGVGLDQLGQPRPFDLVTIANAVDGCDIGAVEFIPVDLSPIFYLPWAAQAE